MKRVLNVTTAAALAAAAAWASGPYVYEGKWVQKGPGPASSETRPV